MGSRMSERRSMSRSQRRCRSWLVSRRMCSWTSRTFRIEEIERRAISRSRWGTSRAQSRISNRRSWIILSRPPLTSLSLISWELSTISLRSWKCHLLLACKMKSIERIWRSWEWRKLQWNHSLVEPQWDQEVTHQWGLETIRDQQIFLLLISQEVCLALRRGLRHRWPIDQISSLIWHLTRLPTFHSISNVCLVVDNLLLSSTLSRSLAFSTNLHW